MKAKAAKERGAPEGNRNAANGEENKGSVSTFDSSSQGKKPKRDAEYWIARLKRDAATDPKAGALLGSIEAGEISARQAAIDIGHVKPPDRGLLFENQRETRDDGADPTAARRFYLVRAQLGSAYCRLAEEPHARPSALDAALARALQTTRLSQIPVRALALVLVDFWWDNPRDRGKMDRKELLRHKREPKVLRGVKFKPLKKNTLPKPFDKMGGARMTHSGLIEVADDSKVLFLARAGETLERRAFFAYWLRHTTAGLLPLVILHYHPSHKGVHAQANCRSDRDYTERQLPGAPELALRTPAGIDPADQNGRFHLIHIFCERCGIQIAPNDDQLL
ncbi:hypothetical protein [Thiocapsa rosea]|uniref:hypothetical protein n=1 Tax=Thiocapsa rosea TaxID=69360 RepID=UPI0011C347C6|nr:hypothetical protein [Thiocapsa rosea]